MPNYRRSHLTGGTYFFTVVTYNRMSFLTEEYARKILHKAWKMVQDKYPFTVDALCLLPNHIHCLWTLPENDDDYSTRWKAIKSNFSRLYRQNQELSFNNNLSRQSKGETTIWQRRFWEHTIRDDQDFSNHFDYIHYNPVKHSYVHRPVDWPWSTFHKYLQAGHYDIEWGDTSNELLKIIIIMVSKVFLI